MPTLFENEACFLDKTNGDEDQDINEISDLDEENLISPLLLSPSRFV